MLHCNMILTNSTDHLRGEGARSAFGHSKGTIMLKTFFAATALLAVSVSPAFAKDGATKTFTRDGETYTYKTVDKGDHVVISGRRQSGAAFELDVRGDQVSGISGGVPVSFTVRDAQKKLTGAQLASR
jgi:hypothetical protein